LTRIATYRLGSTPATRSFAPGKGVGVVGLCWKRNEEVSVDVARLANELETEGQYETYRSQSGGDAVMNLPWRDFVRVRHRGAVFASPIRNGRGEFIGCISIDARDGFDSLFCDDFWHEVNSLCLLLGQNNMNDV